MSLLSLLSLSFFYHVLCYRRCCCCSPWSFLPFPPDFFLQTDFYWSLMDQPSTDRFLLYRPFGGLGPFFLNLFPIVALLVVFITIVVLLSLLSCLLSLSCLVVVVFAVLLSSSSSSSLSCCRCLRCCLVAVVVLLSCCRCCFLSINLNILIVVGVALGCAFLSHSQAGNTKSL